MRRRSDDAKGGGRRLNLVHGEPVKGMTIGQLAAYAPVTIKAVRHYHQRGLHDIDRLLLLARVFGWGATDHRLEFSAEVRLIGVAELLGTLRRGQVRLAGQTVGASNKR